MDPERDQLDGQAPEVVQQNYPEPVQHHYHNNLQPKPEDGTGTHTSSSTAYSHYASPVHQNPSHSYHAGAVGTHPGEKSLSNGGAQYNKKNNKGLLCGCTTLVFVLSVIIAILAAAVIGLAVGTGVEANRAKSAEDKLSAAMSKTSPSTVTATATTASASASSTSFAALDDNCSGDPSAVNGTTYNSFSGECETADTKIRAYSLFVSLSSFNLLTAFLSCKSDSRPIFYYTVQRRRAGDTSVQSLHQRSKHMHGTSTRIILKTNSSIKNHHKVF